VFDWVRRSLNEPSPDDDTVDDDTTDTSTDSATTDDASPNERAPRATTRPRTNKEAKPFIPGADQIQNQPTTFLEPLPWQVQQQYLPSDDLHKSPSAPIAAPMATTPDEAAQMEKSGVVFDKPSDTLAGTWADRATDALSAALSGKSPEKPSHPLHTDGRAIGASSALETQPALPSAPLRSAAPLARTDAESLDTPPLTVAPGTPGGYELNAIAAEPPAVTAADGLADTEASASAAPPIDALTEGDAYADPTLLAPAPGPLVAAPQSSERDSEPPVVAPTVGDDPYRAMPVVFSELPTVRLSPSTPSAGSPVVRATDPTLAKGEAVPAHVQAPTSDIVAPVGVADQATAPLDPNANQGVPYPTFSVRAMCDPDDIAWRIPDTLTQGFDNKDGDSKGANPTPDMRAQAPGLREYVAPAPILPVMGAPEADGVRVDERIRGMARTALAQPQLRASLPDDVIATLQLLLAPAPTPDQIARGMSALSALRTVMEVAQAEAFVAALPAAAQMWYHAPNWLVSRLWLAAHLAELPPETHAQLADAAGQLRAMGADSAAKTVERHARLLDAARRVGVDTAYREVVGDEAFGESTVDENSTNDIAALKRIFDAVIAWIETPNWSASRDYLITHPELLDDEAEAILARMYEVETEQRDQRDRQVIVDHQRLLRDARQLGVEAAYVARARRANAIRESVTPTQAQLAIPLMVWIETPDWNTSREYLRAHPALLSDDGDILLARLAANQTTEHGRQSVADHQRLLSDARERGIDVAYDAFREERRARRRHAVPGAADAPPPANGPETASAMSSGAGANGASGANGARLSHGAKPTSGPAPSASNGTNGSNGANGGNGTHHGESGPTDTPLDARFRRYDVGDGGAGDGDGQDGDGRNGNLT